MALTKPIQDVFQGNPVSGTYQPVAAEVTTLLTEITDGHLPQFVFGVGAVGAPGWAYSGDLNTGGWWVSADIQAYGTGGVEAFRINASQNLLIGGTGVVSGLGASKVDVQGASAASTTVASTANVASTVGPTFQGAKSRSATIGGYTIAQVGDVLVNFEGWGADGAAMVIGARIRAVVEGTPAAGDVRSSWRMFTGNGAGTLAEALRLDISQQMFLPAAGAKLFIGGTAAGNQVLQGRITGWAAATGTPTRTSFATGSVTTAALAQAVKALIDDLMTHGLIGT